MTEESCHECDLFLLTSHQDYFADNALTQFAVRGMRNVDGWGIAGYRRGLANVLRSADPAMDRSSGDPSREFYMAAKAVSSPIILGHLRLTTAGVVSEFNNHPFKLSFLGYDWTMVHNGTATNYEALVPHDERLLLESDNDSARVFEYLRKGIIEYYLRDSRKSLIEGCRKAYSDLLKTGGKFNIILSNGQISFVFIHWRTFYLLQREKQTGAATLISTLKLTDDEEWIKIEKLADRDAKMLVFSGPTLIFNGDIPR